MNKLFLKVSSLSAANKAHEELQIIASKWHHVLVDGKVLENLVVELQQEIARINEKYTRCKDITMNVSRNTHGFTGEYKGIYNISVDGNFYISVHEVKSEVLTNDPLIMLLTLQQSVFQNFDNGKMKKDRFIRITKDVINSIIKEKL